MFKELSIGDVFDIEENGVEVKYIKIEIITFNKLDENKSKNLICVRNAVCIDEHSKNRGRFKFFSANKLVSHVNWS